MRISDGSTAAPDEQIWFNLTLQSLAHQQTVSTSYSVQLVHLYHRKLRYNLLRYRRESLSHRSEGDALDQRKFELLEALRTHSSWNPKRQWLTKTTTIFILSYNPVVEDTFDSRFPSNNLFRRASLPWLVLQS